MATVENQSHVTATKTYSDSVEKMRQRIGRLRVENNCEGEVTAARGKPPMASGGAGIARTPHPSNGFLNPARREPLQTICRLGSFELSLDAVVIEPDGTGNSSRLQNCNGLARSSSRLSVESSEFCFDTAEEQLDVCESSPSNFTNPLFGMSRRAPASPAWTSVPIAPMGQAAHAHPLTPENTDIEAQSFPDENIPPAGV